MITPCAWDVVTTTLPWAFVELMRMFATALIAVAGTAVAAWLLRPGTGKIAALLEFRSAEEGEFAAWLGEEAILELPSCGEAGFAAGIFEEPVLSFAA